MQGYQTFFGQLLAALKSRMPTATTATKVQPFSAFWFSLGRSGVSLYWSFTRDQRFKIDVYIDTPDEKKNFALFDALDQQRQAIENQLGFQPIWDRSANTRVKRISLYYPQSVSITSSTEDLAALQDWALPTTIRMIEVFRPRLQSLPQ